MVRSECASIHLADMLAGLSVYSFRNACYLILHWLSCLSTCFRVINDALLWNSDDFCHCSSSGSFQLSFSLQFGGICRFPCLIPLLHELRLLRGMAKINVRSIFGIGIYFFFLYANMFAFLVWMSTNDQTDQGTKKKKKSRLKNVLQRDFPNSFSSISEVKISKLTSSIEEASSIGKR